MPPVLEAATPPFHDRLPVPLTDEPPAVSTEYVQQYVTDHDPLPTPPFADEYVAEPLLTFFSDPRPLFDFFELRPWRRNDGDAFPATTTLVWQEQGEGGAAVVADGARWRLFPHRTPACACETLAFLALILAIWACLLHGRRPAAALTVVDASPLAPPGAGKKKTKEKTKEETTKEETTTKEEETQMVHA